MRTNKTIIDPTKYAKVSTTMSFWYVPTMWLKLNMKEYFQIVLLEMETNQNFNSVTLHNVSPSDFKTIHYKPQNVPYTEGIDTDILLTIKDDILREKLLNVNLLIANIEALKDNPAPSSDDMTNGSTTTHYDYSLPDYEAFYSDDDHIEEKSSGSTTTHANFSQYVSFIFDLSINPIPPAVRSDFYHEEFADELAHIISPSEYDHFCFKIEPELGNLTMDVVNDIFPTREPRVHVPNVVPTHSTLNMDFILLSEPLFAYIEGSFPPFSMYPIAPPYLLSCGNEDTIFDPGISIYHSFMPGCPGFLKPLVLTVPDIHKRTKIKPKRQNRARNGRAYHGCNTYIQLEGVILPRPQSSSPQGLSMQLHNTPSRTNFAKTPKFITTRTAIAKERRAPNIVEPELRTIVAPMAERTMEELLRAPTEGYGEAIVLPKINADHFEIKMNLLQLVKANPFHGLENENPHAHINSFKRITSTLRFRNVPNDVIKLMMFPYSLEGAAKTWYEKEPPNSILTWEDLVTKFVNQFFPPSKTTHLKNKISRFTQKFDESFSEAWERFKEMLRACPHHGFTELTQVDTFYNDLNDNDQDSINAAAGGNLLSKTAREALNIIENKPNASRMITTSRESDRKYG
ncbi:reverse transcriptase domain-containing protein [Tanacetum coccineum]|uniref:Reverse transcriptase domain-containing protein n=1 Tax=Tanacetum coccineum TaxID=301880 RepID=A0ABQ5E0N4_9ASTR